MSIKNISFKSFNKRDNIAAIIWETKNPKGIIQLVHGICEHIARYSNFAKYLNSHGYIVVGHDQAGHGKSITDCYKGDFGDTGHETLTEDVHTLRKIISDSYPNLNYNLFGHSMGSFVVREYLSKYGSDLSSVILSGTCGTWHDIPKFLSQCEKLIEAGEAMSYSQELANMLFQNYTARIDNPKTPFDWLSTDEKVVQEYMDDENCGFILTVRTYFTGYCMIPMITGESWARKVPLELPIYIFGGDMDPVTNYGEGQYELVNWLWNTRHKNIKAKLYDGYRHEMLHEPIKEEVYSNIVKFLNSVN